jgi:hypothetical protein
VVSLEPMSQTLPFNDQHMVGKIQIWVAACIPLLNCTLCSRFLSSPLLLPDYGEISFQVWTSDCQCNNFIFDTGFITSLVTNRKMCSALVLIITCRSWFSTWWKFSIYSNPHNPSIDRTPLSLHMTSILPALWIGFKSWIMQHAAKVQSCVCAELQSGTLYFLCSWAIGTFAQLSSKQSIIHDWTHWSQGVLGIYQRYIQCLQCESVCLLNRLSNNLIIIFTTR